MVKSGDKNLSLLIFILQEEGRRRMDNWTYRNIISLGGNQVMMKKNDKQWEGESKRDSYACLPILRAVRSVR